MGQAVVHGQSQARHSRGWPRKHDGVGLEPAVGARDAPASAFAPQARYRRAERRSLGPSSLASALTSSSVPSRNEVSCPSGAPTASPRRTRFFRSIATRARKSPPCSVAATSSESRRAATARAGRRRTRRKPWSRRALPRPPLRYARAANAWMVSLLGPRPRPMPSGEAKLGRPGKKAAREEGPGAPWELVQPPVAEDEAPARPVVASVDGRRESELAHQLQRLGDAVEKAVGTPLAQVAVHAFAPGCCRLVGRRPRRP